MEIELEPEEKSVDSFQAEMDLVKEEEETENRLSQKERKELILAKIKNQISSNEESQENPQVLRTNPNILRAAQKKEEISNIPEPFVPNFKLNQRYFYQTINIEEWNEINSFIEKFAVFCSILNNSLYLSFVNNFVIKNCSMYFSL